jgi:hypothetical protein
MTVNGGQPRGLSNANPKNGGELREPGGFGRHQAGIVKVGKTNPLNQPIRNTLGFNPLCPQKKRRFI